MYLVYYRFSWDEIIEYPLREEEPLGSPLGAFPIPSLATTTDTKLTVAVSLRGKNSPRPSIFLISQTSRSAGNQFTLHYHNILVSTF